MAIYAGITDEELAELAELRRKEQFDALTKLPGIWLDRASLHKTAADILYNIAFDANEREFERALKGEAKNGKLEGEDLKNHHLSRLLCEYLLLIGYSLECLFKGSVIGLSPDLVGEDRVNRIVLTHDLQTLAKDAGIKISEEEGRFLALVTRHIIWGKYTAPIHRKDVSSGVLPEDQEEKSLSVSNPFLDRRIQILGNGLFNRGWKHLDKLSKK